MNGPFEATRLATALLAAAALLGAAPSAAAEDADAQLRAEIEALRQEVKQLRDMQRRHDAGWLEERRREELRALIHEVVSETDARTSRMNAMAGHSKKFFLASEDGNFLLYVEGHVQGRYILTMIDDGPGAPADRHEGGFQVRRAKLKFSGHIHDPSLQYKINGGFDRDGGGFLMEDVYVKKRFDGGLYVQGGQFKGRFMREELVSSSAQQAVERSSVNEFFTLDFSQGIQIGADGEKHNWSLLWHDGRENDGAGFADWNNDATEWAVAARWEWLLSGSWSQFKDFQAWAGEKEALMLGVGVDHEQRESGLLATGWDDFTQFAVDLSYENNGFNFFLAYLTRDVSGRSGTPDAEQRGLVAQAGIFIVPDKQDVFIRYEKLDHDGIEEIDGHEIGVTVFGAGTDDDIDIITVGTNWYLHKHMAKITLDYMIASDGIVAGESGTGTIASGGESEQVARLQWQLLF